VLRCALLCCAVLCCAVLRYIPALPSPLQELQGEQTIVFTSSVESTHRLCLLLAALPCLSGAAVEFSSLVAPAERAAHLEAFRSGRAKV
jgi:ATP-dependent RNA helicase DDX51/DBP6